MLINLIQININIPMFKDTNSKKSDIQKGENKANNVTFFSFLKEENLSKEDFEINMNSLISMNVIEKDNLSLINSIVNEKVMLIINNCAKFIIQFQKKTI